MTNDVGHHAEPADRMAEWFRSKNPLLILVVTAIATVLFLNATDGLFLEPIITWRNQFLPDLTLFRIGFVTASGLAGFVSGWLMSGQNGWLRSLLGGLIIGVLMFLTIFDHGAIGWSSAMISAVITFLMGLGYWARGAVQRFMTPPKIFGDSEWASNDELEEAGLLKPKGIRLGYRDVNGEDKIIRYAGDRHLCTFAPNRSGKGTTAIISNLLAYTGSCVVIDPKGENAMITAEYRRSMGQEVHVVDPWCITGLEPSCYNPFDEIDIGDIDMPDFFMAQADAVIPGSEKEPFFPNEAKARLHGITGEVATNPEEADDRNLGRVRDLSLLGEAANKLLAESMMSSPHQFIANAGASMLQKEEKLNSNIAATLQSETHFLDSPRIRDSLSKSDFRFADLKTKPMTIYLVLPSDKLDSHGHWLRILIQQALMINARNIETQPEEPVLFILDELPALGRLPMVEKAFGLMAGYGIQIWAIAQDNNQLKRIYHDGWETFISNAGVLQYFGSRDKFTAEYFSSLCGVKTVWSLSSAIGRTIGRSSSSGANGSTTESVSDSDTATYNTTQCQMAYPDQLMRMDKGKQLLFVENMNPIIADKVPWFEDPELKDKGVNLHAEQAKKTAA